MAFLEYKHVRIAGMASGMPKHISRNLHPGRKEQAFFTEYTPEDFVETTGVEERRTARHLCTSDLCYAAAEQLIKDLKWNKSDIDALLVVTQTPDYILPATACILQDRLGLNKECYATDMSIGCSGWVYGLSAIMGLVETGHFKKALLMVGDARRRAAGPPSPLFGQSGTVTAIEFARHTTPVQFHFGTDGSGFDAIITPDGGSRNQFSAKSFRQEDVEGKMLNRLQTRMKGMDVFSFGITTAPKSVKKLAEHFGFDYLDADYFVFHQANMKMNDLIAKKLKLPAEKVPSSMRHFGNTNGASIPNTIVTQLTNDAQNKRFICCGFGVGLSWGTVAFQTDNIVISKLVEVKDKIATEYVI